MWVVVPSNWLPISNYHALIKKSDDRYHIYDGDGYRPSTNGLFLNQTRITPSEGHPLENRHLQKYSNAYPNYL